MTALTAEREDGARIGPVTQFNFPVAAATVIRTGWIVMLNASGEAVAGATATGQTCVGRACETVDNSAGAAGDLRINVDEGTFDMKNDEGGADEVDSGDEGSTVYIVDNQTVALTDGGATRSAAGVAAQLQDDSIADSPVFVKMGPTVQPA